MIQRTHKRIKMVLPVRLWGRDSSGDGFDELAYTLDITPTGARVGGIRHRVVAGDTMFVQYRRRKVQFRIVWVRLLLPSREYQIGLESIARRDAWGLDLSEANAPERESTSGAAAAAGASS